MRVLHSIKDFSFLTRLTKLENQFLGIMSRPHDTLSWIWARRGTKTTTKHLRRKADFNPREKRLTCHLRHQLWISEEPNKIQSSLHKYEDAAAMVAMDYKCSSSSWNILLLNSFCRSDRSASSLLLSNWHFWALKPLNNPWIRIGKLWVELWELWNWSWKKRALTAIGTKVVKLKLEKKITQWDWRCNFLIRI